MSRRPFLTRFASWLAVTVMLVRVAVPMLAVGAAHLHGVAVGSVCTVYGVVLPGSTGSAHAGHEHHHAEHANHDGSGSGSDEAHTGDHCALTALAELAVSHASTVAAVADGRHATAGLTESVVPAWGDASATWIARRKQGPPTIA